MYKIRKIAHEKACNRETQLDRSYITYYQYTCSNNISIFHRFEDIIERDHATFRESMSSLSQGLEKPLFCVPTAKDELLSEPGQSLSSLTEQVVRQSQVYQ